MPLNFVGSHSLTLGVEIEFQLLNPETLNLVANSEEILRLCREKKIDQVKSELHQSMLEVNTPICETVKQCKENLYRTIRTVHELCDQSNLLISISGTHPFQQWSESQIHPSRRNHYLASKFRWLARRMNIYGMHLHIGIKDANQGVQLVNGLIPYLPLFLALSSSSPFWQGIDTGFHSCRLGIIESFPYSGVPPFFNDWDEFENYYDTLRQAEAVLSTKDFYWYIRPNAKFGTIEIRIFDAMPTMTETVALVALAQCIAKSIIDGADQEQDPYYHWISPSNILIASRDGVDGVIITEKSGKKQTIKEQAHACLKNLAPIAQELDCLEEMNFIETILKNGNSSQRQKKIFAETQDLQAVVSAIQKETKQSFIDSG
jgi:carboxylate-amine ligase